MPLVLVGWFYSKDDIKEDFGNEDMPSDIQR